MKDLNYQKNIMNNFNKTNLHKLKGVITEEGKVK